MLQDRILTEDFKENIKIIETIEIKAKIQQQFYIWIKMIAIYNSVVTCQLIRRSIAR